MQAEIENQFLLATTRLMVGGPGIVSASQQPEAPIATRICGALTNH